MTKDDYDNIAKCVRKKGTIKQRKALKAMMLSTGWDLTHENKLEIDRLHKKIAELQLEISLLKRKIRREVETK